MERKQLPCFKKGYRKTAVYFILLIGLFFSRDLKAQSFGGCGTVAYIFQGDPTGVYSLDLASGVYRTVMNPVLPNVKLNAVGFDPIQSYLWAVNTKTAELVRVDAGFNAAVFTVPELPVRTYYVGDINNEGIYHLYTTQEGGKIYKIDVSSGAPTYISAFGAAAGNIHDIAFNPIDGDIYTIEKNTNRLKRIDHVTGQVTNLGAVPGLSGKTSPYGAVFFDGSGDFYASENSTGHIYRIRSVQDLNAGDYIGSTLFAYGPSSSNNDGAKCASAEISNEGCANDINDDEDEDTDCEDSECDSNIACEVGGGGGGGLESNSRLSQKIAYRDFWRAKHNVDLEDKNNMPRWERSRTYGKQRSSFFRSDYSIQDFIPVDVIPETESFVSSPKDLTLLSNAVEVASVDVFDENRRVSTVLALKTEDGVYEHTKYICDRVKGGKIRNITYRRLDGEHDFAVTRFVNANGGNELATLFSLYKNEEGNFVVESHWNLDDYPKNKTYYNFQVWAHSFKKLELLTKEILRLATVQAPLSSFNLTEAPEVYITEVWYENKEMHLVVANPIGANELELEGIKRKTETATPEDYFIKLALKGTAVDTLIVPTEGLFTLNGKVTNNLTEIKDQFFLGGGAWGYFGTEDGYQIDQYDVTTSNADKYSDEAMWIERDLYVKGSLKGELSIYRTMKAGTQPVDYNIYNAVAFEVEGSGVLEVVLAKAGIEKWEDQPRARFNIDGRCTQVYLDRLDFYQKDGQYSWEDIESISFIQKGDGKETKNFELKISSLAFVNIDEKPECDAYNATRLQAFPNPMKNELNIVLSATGAQEYDLTFSNQLGQVIAFQSGVTDIDGRINLKKAGLAPGMYFYTVDVTSGTYSGKVMVRK